MKDCQKAQESFNSVLARFKEIKADLWSQYKKGMLREKDQLKLEAVIKQLNAGQEEPHYEYDFWKLISELENSTSRKSSSSSINFQGLFSAPAEKQQHFLATMRLISD